MLNRRPANSWLWIYDLWCSTKNHRDDALYPSDATIWIYAELSSVRFSNINLRAISQKIVKSSITKFSLTITFLKWIKMTWNVDTQNCCCCRGACQISERLEKSKPESRGFDASRDLVVGHPSALWIEAHDLNLRIVRSSIHLPISITWNGFTIFSPHVLNAEATCN